MQSRINQGRTYGGGTGLPPPPGCRDERVASNANGASIDSTEARPGAFSNSTGPCRSGNQEATLSQADSSRRPQDPRKSAARDINSVTRKDTSSASHADSSMQQAGHTEHHLTQRDGTDARPAQSLLHPMQASTSNKEAARNDRQVQSAGQVRGILKTRPVEATKPIGSLNVSQNKAFEKEKAAEVAAADPLAGQTVTVDSLTQPIKPLSKTLEALRAGKPWQQAFQSKQASYLFNDAASTGKVHDEDVALTSIPVLSVYFPMSVNKEAPHNPAECGKVCNGAPHIDRAPVCRFCRARLGPKYKEVPVISPRQCLEHLQNCPGIPEAEDRKLLYDAFRKVDERFIKDSHTMVWAPRVKAAEVVQPKPLLPPKARPQTGAASVPMGRKTSGGSHPAASRPPKTTTTGTSHSRGRTFQTPPATFVPIAAKQLPNRVPTMPAVRRDNPPINAPTMPAAMRLARANATNHGHNATLGMSAAPSGSVSGSADARWGVSVQSATYAQHAPSEDSEEDELEEPQHDPEDNFTWQAVREKLNNAQISNEHPSSRPTAPANNETDQFVGAEIIPEPHGAPSGGSFLPTRHISVTPSRPVSSVVYRGPVGDSAADTSAEELTCTGYTSVPLSHGQGGPAVDHASVSFVPSGSPQGSGRNLFRPASPSHTRHAPPNNVNVQRVHTSQREPSPETHDMPEPELPAEDPWDLEPEPGFEPFFASAENVTSDTSALRRQVTRRPLSSRDIEARVARSDALQREPNRHEEKGKGVSRHSSRASSLALSGSDMDISDASNSTVPSGSARTAVQQSAEAAGNAPAVRKSKSRMRKERKRAKAAKRAAKNAALLRPELQGLEDEQIAHRQVLQEKEILGVRDQVKQKGEEKQQEIGKRNQKQAKSQEQTNKLDKENGGMAKRSDKDIRHASNPRVRSPSVECLNPIRQLSGSSRPTSHSQETNIVSDSMAPRNNKASNVDSDDDGNVPLRMLHSSPKEQVANKGVVEISSSSEDEPEPALHPQSRRQSETAARAKSPLGPIARKSTKKDREKAAEVVASRYDDENEDSALSDSDSDAPFVTSRRVDPSIFRPIPEVEIVRNASSGKPANRGRPSMANSRPTVVKSKRAPTPSDPSESESEPAVKEPTASQSAAFARRFQRFADRDRSPELVRKRRSKGKEKQKARNDDEQGAIHAKPRIVRREVDDHANTASSPGLSKQRKRRIKTIHSSDEEEEVSHGKRLRTYDEHQSQTRQDSALPGSSRESSRASSTGSNHVSNGMDLSVVPPPEHFSRDFAPFFVDVQKNVDNVLSLPHELDPWIDIFQAADVLSLDTLQYCVRKPENADEFVKWVLARTGREMSLAKQFPLVQAIQHVLTQG